MLAGPLSSSILAMLCRLPAPHPRPLHVCVRSALACPVAAEGALPVAQLGEEQRRRLLLAHLCGMALGFNGEVEKYVFEVVGQRIWGAWNGGK